MIEGEIKVGDRLIWETLDPKAFELVTVVEIRSFPADPDGPWVRTEGKRGLFWHTEENVREVCIRAEPFTGPSVLEHIDS